MDRSARLARRLGLFVLLFAVPAVVGAQDAPDEDREQKVTERFLGLLEKTPRRGTALDKVYGYHVERGTLDTFLGTYRGRAEKEPKDGTAWLILGLMESQRGRDAAAVEALRKAEQARPDDPIPPYYLGQALVLVGQPEAAAEAFERAIARKPARSDLLEVYQALGRVHQRAHHNDKALAVWTRLEKQFPDDLAVQEQIAAALAEESGPAEALPRYEALAKKATDPYRRTLFRMDAADLKVRLGKPAEALQDFEAMLGQLNPDSWLHREVRRKIEEVFLKNDDQAGLAAYYEKWLAAHQDDVDVMARLGRSLAVQGRAVEARSWLDRAVKRAPTRKELRQALIEQLVFEKKYAEAAKQYEAMAKADPNNPDIVRDWGRLILRDESRPEPERKKAAAVVWRKLVEAKPKDPAIAVQVADLLRQAELNDEAIALYRKAVDLSPDAAQYREYLGQFLHDLKRPEEAVAAWSAMAAGKNRNAKNLGRLAEVLAGFGYRKEALEAIGAACQLDADTFDLQVKYADLLLEAERYDDVLKQLEVADKAADDAEQREAVLDRQIKAFQESRTLPAQVAALARRLADPKNASGEAFRRLARYLEAEQRLPEALLAIKRSLELDARAIPSWVVLARLQEQSGNLGAAADAYRKLSELDRRARSEHLTAVAKLESRLGRRDEAMKAGRDLLAASPGNPEAFQFFADLCFQLGQADEGLDVLRRAVRLNEADTRAILSLAETLAGQFRTEEAIEMFWRAFDRSPDLDAKLGVVSRLTSLYLQRNQFDRLVARLELAGREDNRRREATLCLAAAYAASGDYGTARQELERLLTTNTRDTQLLGQLSTLAETEGDLATAAKYQKQLHEVAPSDENAARLAQLYVREGEVAEAEAIWAKMAGGESDAYRVLQAIDSLLGNHKEAEVLEITDRLLRKSPEDWEALYRAGVALARSEKPDRAAERFRALLAVSAPDEAESAIAKARKKGLGKPGGTLGVASPRAGKIATVPLQDRIGMAQQIRSAVGLDARYGFGPTNSWSPGDFGQARMAALGWLYALAQRTDKADELVKSLRGARDKAPRDARPAWDLYYLNIVRMDHGDVFDAARALAKAAANDPAAHWAFLGSLPTRGSAANRGGGYVMYTPGVTPQDTTTPLKDDELNDVLASFAALRRRRPEWVQTAILTAVADELKRSKATEREDAFYRDAVAAANEPDAVASVLRLAAERGDVPGVLAMFDRYLRLSNGRALGPSMNAYSFYGTFYMPPANPSDSFARAMGVRFDAKAPADTLALLDRYLAATRQPDQVAYRARSKMAANPFASANNRVQVWTSKQARWVTIDYPPPNTYFDLGALQVLRDAFELYKRDDLLSDLSAHFDHLPADATDADRTFAELALAYIDWWADEKDDALRHLTRAAELSRSDPELMLALAELRAQRNEPEEALAVADSFEPLDQKTMQRREILALRLAVLTGDIDRARRAAERLFNLRIEADTQVQLAAQMHQLGMHELAEAVLGRARRRVGNNVQVLVNLMNQYQRQSKPEVAVQVAYQILRRNTSRQFSPYNYNEGDAAQREAIGVLARSGKLAELIKRAEAQVERSPGSVQLHQALADYYKAAGEKDKVKAEYDAIAKIRPDDARVRFQIGQQLQQSGEAAASVEHYTAAIRKEPSLLNYRYWEIQQAFSQADRSEDFMALLDEVDLRQFGQPWAIGNIIQEAVRDPKKKAVGIKLFHKAWKAFPNERGNLLANTQGTDELIQLPEMYDYIREAALPRPDQSRVPAWSGLDQVILWMGEGKVLGYGNHLLEVAARQAKLEALATELDGHIQRLPDWKAGRVLRALVDARRGRVEAAKPVLEALLATDKEDAAPPPMARMIVGPELERYGPLEPIAVGLYESATKSADDEQGIMADFEYSPARRLVALYKRRGRNEDARQQVLAALRRGEDDRYSFDPAYAAYQKIQQRTAIGGMLLDLGYPADSARVFGDLIADAETLRLANSMGWGNNQPELLRGSLDRALEGLNGETLAPTLRSLAHPDRDAKAKAPAVDLVLLVHPRGLESSSVTSLFAASLKAAAETPGLLAELAPEIDRAAAEHPDDLAAQVASALAALAATEGAKVRPALDRLLAFVDACPLEDLPAGARANARQRQQAAPFLALWLVARECAEQGPHKEAAARLADRALDAARRQADNSWTLAMLRESAQSALDRGDRAAAEERFARMLDTILAVHSAPKVVASSPSPAPAESNPPAPKAKGAAPKGPTVPVTTLDRFEQAMELARLVARKGLVELSLRAVRETLRGGPPVVPMEADSNNRRVVVRNNLGQNEAQDQNVRTRVEQALSELERTWQAKKAEPSAVYDVLAGAILPEGRPGEVFLYPLALAGNAARPRSAADILVRWAVRAEKGDDLRARAEARRSGSLAEVPAAVLLGQLALARGEVDAAKKALDDLAQTLEKDKLQTTAELACLVALPALKEKAIEAAAVALVESAVKLTSGTNTAEPAESLAIALAHHQFDAGRGEHARAQLREALALGERVAAMSQGNAAHQRRQVYRKIAAEYARAGQWTEALDVLGQYADVPPAPGYNAEAGAHPLAPIARMLAALPPPQRFEVLRTWTLPTTSRKAVRIVGAFVPEDAPPRSFGPRRPVADRGVASTVDLLIAAAKELNQLDALAADLAKAEEGKVENAAAALTLVRLAQGRDDEVRPRLAALLDEWTKTKADNTNPWAETPKNWWPDYLQVRAALARPSLSETGRRLARTFPNTAFEFAVPAHLARDLADAEVARDGVKTVSAGGDPGLALWAPADLLTAAQHGMGPVPAWWVAQGGHVHHKAGGAMRNPYISDAEAQGNPTPGPDSLALRLPLAGRFEFSVEVHGQSGELGFGGLVIQPGVGGNQTIWRDGRSQQVPTSRMTTVGGADSIPKLCRALSTAGYNRLSVRVEPGQVTYLINGQPYFEDRDPSPTAPWLALFAGPSGPTDFRNLALTGAPEVPAEVRLSHADRLEGWTAHFYNETIPTRRARDATGRKLKALVASATSDEERDWSAADGEIRGRRLESRGGDEPNQSRLTYQRPLGPGESLSYEFFYEPDSAAVHPALGRLAFLLEPAGVRLHWMTDGQDHDWTGLAPSNVADDPSARRGPDRLPLVEGDWNRVNLRLNDAGVTITLNEVAIYVTELEPSADRLFSFYHDKSRTVARARNVVLRGDWPTALPVSAASDLAALREPGAPAERHARSDVIGETYFARDVEPLLEWVATLPASERFDRLAAWVLPAEDHANIRLTGEFSPADPAPPAPRPADAPTLAARTQAGGELVAPAVALVGAAKEAGRLDDLLARVEAIPPRDDLDRRARLALLALIQLAAGRDAKADEAFAALVPRLKAVPADAPESERWPELVALSAAVGHEKAPASARALARVLVPEEKEKSADAPEYGLPYWLRITGRVPINETWKKHAARVATLVDADAPLARDDSAVPDRWARVTQPRSATRGAGAPPAGWVARGDLIEHVPGHDHDFLFLRTPLRGAFVLTGELVGPRPPHLSYGGITVGLAADGKGLIVSKLGRLPRSVALNPPLEAKDGPRAFQLSVQDGGLALHVDGRKVYEEGLPSEPDPWLALYQPATARGGVRNLKFGGKPAVPERIDLAPRPDLTGWLADAYDESMTGDEPAWEKRGDEVFGRRFKDLAGSHAESLLQYHRPLLEDGTVRYEFFYEPGRTLVHPALDRLALRLDPDGVRVHWLTDAAHERHNLPSDNAAAEPAHRRGPDRLPLKEKEWNAVTLSVAGDTLRLTLNDTLIFERPIEPTNQRLFGLFHESGDTEARARNLQMESAWPRQLPPALTPDRVVGAD